jgi:hypothetical protein
MFVHETQKMAVMQTDDDTLRTELEASRKEMRLYAEEAEHILNGVQELIDQLNQEVCYFRSFHTADSLILTLIFWFCAF